MRPVVISRDTQGPLRTACALVRFAGVAPRAVAVLRGLPRFTLRLSASPAGRDIASAYAPRRWGGQLKAVAVPVLDLPDDPATYLRGRSRQAVRTNCSKAKRDGLTYRRPESVEHVVDMVDSVISRRPDGARERAEIVSRLHGPGSGFRYVADRAGNSIAHIEYTTDGIYARLNWGISAVTPMTSPARYLLAAELFQELAADGVRHVLVDSGLFTPAGVVYFEDRLGFTARTLDFEPGLAALLRAGRPVGSERARWRGSPQGDSRSLR